MRPPLFLVPSGLRRIAAAVNRWMVCADAHEFFFKDLSI